MSPSRSPQWEHSILLLVLLDAFSPPLLAAPPQHSTLRLLLWVPITLSRLGQDLKEPQACLFSQWLHLIEETHTHPLLPLDQLDSLHSCLLHFSVKSQTSVLTATLCPPQMHESHIKISQELFSPCLRWRERRQGGLTTELSSKTSSIQSSLPISNPIL